MCYFFKFRDRNLLIQKDRRYLEKYCLGIEVYFLEIQLLGNESKGICSKFGLYSRDGKNEEEEIEGI